MMRTVNEIAEKANASTSWLGFDKEVLVPYLPFDLAKPYLKEGTTEQDWKPTELTKDVVLAEMKDYMDFAWGKVEDHRGISAGRSVEKMEAWLFILGDDETLAKVEAAGYPQYGAPKLAVICEAYGWPIPATAEVQRMIRGEVCGCGWDCGCGM